MFAYQHGGVPARSLPVQQLNGLRFEVVRLQCSEAGNKVSRHLLSLAKAVFQCSFHGASRYMLAVQLPVMAFRQILGGPMQRKAKAVWPVALLQGIYATMLTSRGISCFAANSATAASAQRCFSQRTAWRRIFTKSTIALPMPPTYIFMMELFIAFQLVIDYKSCLCAILSML